MDEQPGEPGAWDRYRQYLLLLARAQLQPGDRAEPSDIVQQTLMDAHRDQRQFRGQTPAQRAAWLRRILANNLADIFKGQRREKRDVARERSLEQALAESSASLGACLQNSQASPSQDAQRDEQAVRVAHALASLPAMQREALLLQHWQGKSLAEIAQRLDRTPAAVAGLLKRGLQALRGLLQEDET